MMRCASRVVLITLSIVIHARASAQQSDIVPPAPTVEPQPAPAEPELPPPPTAALTAPPSDSVPAEVLQLSEDELSALGLDEAQPSVDLSLKISGFADFGFWTVFVPQDSFWRTAGTVPPHSSFYVGNLNVYLQKQFTETLSTMAEVRFSFLPNGSTAFGFGERQNTTAFDYTDFGRPTRWGAIIIQRMYVQWQPYTFLAIRGGQFLSPFGVWNVDHGSPVVIPIRRPWSVGVGWIPEKQTGLELFGRARLSAHHAIGYHLTLSNGVGPVSEYADLDENKAIGGRLYWEIEGLGRLRLGGSGYYGRNTDAKYDAVINMATATVKARDIIASQYDALTWSGDVTWDLGDLHVQTEWIGTQQAYTPEGRGRRMGLTGPVIPSDVFSWGGYGLIGYRLPWFGIMPFLLVERVSGDISYAAVKLSIIQFGLNVRPVDELVIKVAWDHVEQDLGDLGPLNVLLSQVAWAF